jgi:porin
MKIFYIFSLFIAIASGVVSAQNKDSVESKSFTFSASYVAENANVISGGIKTGSCYLGMANLRLGFDTEKANWWKGGLFYINAANTHGDEPSASYVGDFQVMSNIEAGNHTYVQELWFKQSIGNVDVTVGLQDLNVEFLNTEATGTYLNSSFGVIPVLSGNLSVPIFPLTSLGVTSKWLVNENFSWLNALYDGVPTDFDENPYNLNWAFKKGDGLLAITEAQFASSFFGLDGIYKVGAYTHNHFYENDLQDTVLHNNYGIYTISEQNLWQNGAKKVSAFVQASISPKRYNANYYYVGAGVNYVGLLSKRSNDVLGLAFAHAGFKDGIKPETSIELTYKALVYSNWFIQPDFQYIINPSGTGMALNNGLVASLRVGISL